MHDFTLAAIGGATIGLSAVMMLALLGRITGISGIFWTGVTQAVKRKGGEIPWQLLFLVGLVAGAFIAHQVFAIPIPDPSASPTVVAVLAGLLVGFGTNFGSGCTSGHGVCGISRFSMRSIIATLVFMLFGIVTVYLVRHLLGGFA